MLDRFDPLAAAQALMALVRQTNRLLRLSFPRDDGPKGALLVANKLQATEAVSQDFEFTVEVLSDKPDIELKDVLGKMVSIALVRDDGSLRYFNGYVFEFRFIKNDAGFAYYQMVLRPWLAFLKYRKDNSLFLGQALLEQTQTLLERYAIRDWQIQYLDSPEAVTYACQWDESDYNYLHRRWEAEGWHYHYEHRDNGHTLVLSGDSTTCEPIDGGGEITWQGNSGVQNVGITQLSPLRKIGFTRFSATSFDFKSPNTYPNGANERTTTSLNKQGSVLEQMPQLEEYLYTGAYGFKDSTTGDQFVRRRMQAMDAANKTFTAVGDDPNAQPGRCFTLSGHTDAWQSSAEQDGESDFLVLSVVHTATNNHEARDGGAAAYSNTLTCIRKKIPWRPAPDFNSFQPKIYGVQTATVVTLNGEEIYTDAYGRVLVQFHWDRSGLQDGKSSAWIRVSSLLAGTGYGQSNLPRAGQEVIVQFLDGNPDRPIITGVVPNAQNMPPRFSHTGDLPGNKALSGTKTQEIQGQRYNQLRMDDTTGQISAQLASEHGHSQLNLGFLTQPRTDGHGDKRGEGLEIRTDLAGAIRAARGLLISTDAQARAGGQLLDRQELVGQLETALAIAKQLAELAQTHEAEKADTTNAAAAQKLLEHLKAWDSQQPGGAAAIAMTAPDGIALSSPNSVTASSGTNVDIVAVQDTNVSTGRTLLLRAGQGLSAFVHKLGIKLVAAAGKISVIAQSDEMELGAAKRLHVYSLKEMLLEAPQIVLRGEGAQITIGDGKVVLSATAKVEGKAPDFSFGGSGGGSLDLPNMPASTLVTDERIAFSGRSGKARENLPYEVRDTAGSVQDVGTSAADGATQSTVTDTAIKALTVHLKL